MKVLLLVLSLALVASAMPKKNLQASKNLRGLKNLKALKSLKTVQESKRSGEEGDDKPDILHLLEDFIGPREHYYLFHYECPAYLQESYGHVQEIAGSALETFYDIINSAQAKKQQKRDGDDDDEWYGPVRKIVVQIAKNIVGNLDPEVAKWYKETYCDVASFIDAVWKTDPIQDLRVAVEGMSPGMRDKALDRWCWDQAIFFAEVIHQYFDFSSLGSSGVKRGKRGVDDPLNDWDRVAALEKLLLFFDEKAHDNLASYFACDYVDKKRTHKQAEKKNLKETADQKEVVALLKKYFQNKQ